VSFPGPSGTVLVLELLALALVSTLLGESVRRLAGRWVAAWRQLEAVERVLLDFFLGGAALYLLAGLPIGAFSLFSVGALFVVGAVGVGWVAARAWRAGTLSARTLLAPFVRPATLLTGVAALGLLVFEVAVALPIGTGNTYDSSLLTFYTARLIDGHQLASSFLPSARVGILYPQGTTAWLGTAQLVLGMPGARTSLLLTPLFFALAPVGGFVLGRRLFEGDVGGLAFAVVLAALASWTRVLVAGSNDFVFAFPLVLWLAGQAVSWMRAVPSRAEAIGFGLLLGYSAALNPMGAEWLTPGLLVMGAAVAPRWAGSARRWFARWGTAMLTALVPLLPTWYVLAEGWSTPGYLAGTASISASSSGAASARFLGYVDPYLFGPQDVWLSPVPALRAEIVILLTVGLVVLFFAGPATLGPRYPRVRAFLLGGVLATVGLLGVDWAGTAGGPLGALAKVISESEASIWLLTLYALIATLPLVRALEGTIGANVPRPTTTGPAGRSRTWHPDGHRQEIAAVLPIVIALAIVVPGAVLTPTQLAPVLTSLYTDFGHVTQADFDLLEYAGAHLPGGARVLVAPGSAGEFLPAYAPSAVLLYPMVPGWGQLNASYTLVVSELTNATLSAGGNGALRTLDVQFILVTPANTILWPAFSATPLLQQHFPVLFSEGGDYLFGLPPPVVPASTAP
jgi:hypothetical protein